MKWYSKLIKKIENYGNNIFLFDLENLLLDKNFFNELSLKYDIFLYETDEDYFIFKNYKSPFKLIYSTKYVKRFFTRNAISISVKDVFDKLDCDKVKNMDVYYYQKLYDYCNEGEVNNFVIFSENTYNIIAQSIWGIDLATLFDPTTNLKIGLEYLVEKKDLDLVIIEKISKNLNVNLKDLYDNDKEISKFIESIILEYINEEISHKYNLSDNLIQYYLSKVDLKSNLISNAINNNLLNKYPWLIRYKINDSSSEYILDNIKSNINDFKIIYNQLYDDNKIDLNDIENVFKLSKKFFNVIYQIQINNYKLSDFNCEMMYNCINNLFMNILDNGIYEQLFNFPYDKRPFTVDRILDYINYNYKSENIALIVMDGMSYDEWFILKRYLTTHNIKELESFAILPSITKYSRTAIFTGKTPNGFLNDKYKLKKDTERGGFENYFKEKNVLENDIFWGRIDLNRNIIKNSKVELKFEFLKGYKIIGLVCNLFDDESHSINIFGENKSNLYKNIKSAIESSELIHLINNLKEEDYTVILTADHGNIYCEGNGISSNKMLESERESIRCLIFDSEKFADKLVNNNPHECYKYNYNILSNQLYLVFAKNGCFENKIAITHGGFSPEECIVPLVIL